MNKKVNVAKTMPQSYSLFCNNSCYTHTHTHTDTHTHTQKKVRLMLLILKESYKRNDEEGI